MVSFKGTHFAKDIIERQSTIKNGPYVFHRDEKPLKDFRYAGAHSVQAADVTRYFHDFRSPTVRNLTCVGGQKKLPCPSPGISLGRFLTDIV